MLEPLVLQTSSLLLVYFIRISATNVMQSLALIMWLQAPTVGIVNGKEGYI